MICGLVLFSLTIVNAVKDDNDVVFGGIAQSFKSGPDSVHQLMKFGAFEGVSKETRSEEEILRHFKKFYYGITVLSAQGYSPSRMFLLKGKYPNVQDYIMKMTHASHASRLEVLLSYALRQIPGFVESYDSFGGYNILENLIEEGLCDSSCDAIRSKHANQYQQFIVYKKVNGQTLFDILMDPQYYKMISPKFITSIFGECMKAIKLAAEKYVYHLDIHSENVLFESRISPDITNLPEIRIIDYGFGALKVNDGKDWEMVFPHLIPTELGAKFSKKGAASIDIKYLFLTLFRDIDCKVIREWNSEEMQIKYERELLILNTLWNRIFPDEKESWSLTETILNNGVCREGEFSPEHKFSGFCDYRKRFDCLLDESTFVSIDDVHSILHGL